MIPTCHLDLSCARDTTINKSDGRMVRAFTFGVVDSSLIPNPVKSMTLKLVFTASLLDAQHNRDSVENKSASLLVVRLEKKIIGIPSSKSDRQMADNF